MTREDPGTESGLDLRIAADSGAIPDLLDRLEAYAETAELPPRLASHLTLICEELAANVAIHGRAGPAGASFIAFSLRRSGGALHLRVEDDGPAFDPLSLDAPDTDASLEERALGGVGIHLVRTLAQALRYERAGPCNRLDLVLGAEI